MRHLKPERAEITIAYKPRPQFLPFHSRAERFACIVSHRRAGKTVACIHELHRAALTCERANPRFAYVCPFLTQAKSIAWDYLRAAAAAGQRVGARVHESELRVDYPNGARVRLFGADNPDALRGHYFDGIVFDEYADMDRGVWEEVLRPTLIERQGWAVFIGTPKGKNAFFEIWHDAQSDPDWFALMLKASQTGLIPEEELKAVRGDLSEEQYAQEFECSFDAALVGAFYAKLMKEAQEENRVRNVPHDPSLQVWTAWDLGIADATAIWFAQVAHKEIHIIDYYESSGVELGDYVRELLQNRKYIYAGHIVPHDAQAKELGTGKSRIELMQSLGLRNVTVAPSHFVKDGIEAVRVLLPRCWFDAQKCARGIDALTRYHANYDDKREMLQPRAVHDWTSHAADAFRYLAMGLRDEVRRKDFNRPLVYPDFPVV